MKKILILSFALASTIFFPNSIIRAGENHDRHHKTGDIEKTTQQGNSHHHHKTVMLPEGQPIPQVNLVVHQDTMKGWNLEIQLENFALTPENVNQPNIPNEGHAHLFINGEKITRIYGNWYHLSQLPSGSNEIKIELNTNQHESLMYRGQMISDTITINVP